MYTKSLEQISGCLGLGGAGGKGELLLLGIGLLVGDKNVPKLTVVSVVQL